MIVKESNETSMYHTGAEHTKKTIIVFFRCWLSSYDQSSGLFYRTLIDGV